MGEKALRFFGFVVLGLVLVLGVFAAIQVVSVSPLWGESGAAWVQAVGSIAAIVGSFALARYQGRDLERQRRIERLDRDAEQAVVCQWLANDTFACLSNLEAKIGDRRARPGRAIGQERLKQIQQTLLALASRDIHPELIKEIILLQREVAYSLTAIRQLGRRQATETRYQGASNRSQKVLKCKDRLTTTVLSFRKQADDAKL